MGNECGSHPDFHNIVESADRTEQFDAVAEVPCKMNIRGTDLVDALDTDR